MVNLCVRWISTKIEILDSSCDFSYNISRNGNVTIPSASSTLYPYKYAKIKMFPRFHFFLFLSENQNLMTIELTLCENVQWKSGIKRERKKNYKQYIQLRFI